MTSPQDPFATPGDQPPAQVEQPTPGYGAPTPGYGPPAPEYGHPPSGYGAAPGYGAPPPGYPAYGPPPGYPPAYGHPPYSGTVAARATNGFAIASMVLGILWIYWLGSILALVFGYIALKQIKQRGEGGRGMAIAGVVLGWIGVAVIPLIVLVVFAVGTGVKGEFEETCEQFTPSGSTSQC